MVHPKFVLCCLLSRREKQQLVSSVLPWLMTLRVKLESVRDWVISNFPSRISTSAHPFCVWHNRVAGDTQYNAFPLNTIHTFFYVPCRVLNNCWCIRISDTSLSQFAIDNRDSDTRSRFAFSSLPTLLPYKKSRFAFSNNSRGIFQSTMYTLSDLRRRKISVPDCQIYPDFDSLLSQIKLSRLHPEITNSSTSNRNTILLLSENYRPLQNVTLGLRQFIPFPIFFSTTHSWQLQFNSSHISSL